MCIKKSFFDGNFITVTIYAEYGNMAFRLWFVTNYYFYFEVIFMVFVPCFKEKRLAGLNAFVKRAEKTIA